MTRPDRPIRTDIGWSNATSITVFGKDLPSEILGHLNLGDMGFMELTGRAPTAAESKMFNAMVVTLVEHGLEPAAALRLGGELLEVHPHREVVLTVGGEDQRPNRVVGGDIGEQLLDPVDGLQRHPVDGWILVDDCHDPTILFDPHDTHLLGRF